MSTKPHSDICQPQSTKTFIINFILILSVLQISLSSFQNQSIISYNISIEKYINLKLYLIIQNVKISTESISYYNYATVIQAKNNKIVHSLNGNRSGHNKIKIVQLNKGPSLLKNYTSHLDRIISDEKPNILCLSESNIYRSES